MPPEPAVPPNGFADVSVVTPAFDARATVARTLASIAAQTLRPREVVVVDDGSTDGTGETAEAFAPHMRGIALRVLRQENRGAAAARNVAIRAASGRWLAFLDADDEWLPAKIERCLAELARRGADMAAHDYIRVENGTERVVGSSRHCPPDADPFSAQLLYGFISSTTVVVRRDLVLGVGGFDPSLRSSHDYELWLALLAEPTTRFCMLAEPLSRYHIVPGGISSNVDRRRAASLAALGRHWRTLKGRAAGPAAVAALRALIVYGQAAAAYAAQRRYGAAMRDCVLAPAAAVALLAAPPPPPRPRFL
jgi:glycosyltransferase involved in cell wall biosynthesis